MSRCRPDVEKCAKHIGKQKVRNAAGLEPIFRCQFSNLSNSSSSSSNNKNNNDDDYSAQHYNYHYNNYYNYNYTSATITTTTSTTLRCLQARVGPSVGSLCDPSFTATNLL